jgi:hypothetical protein
MAHHHQLERSAEPCCVPDKAMTFDKLRRLGFLSHLPRPQFAGRLKLQAHCHGTGRGLALSKSPDAEWELGNC